MDSSQRLYFAEFQYYNERMKKIVENKIQCNHCGAVLISSSSHDLNWCSCGCVAVDGGTEYLKRLFKNSPADYTELSTEE